MNQKQQPGAKPVPHSKPAGDQAPADEGRIDWIYQIKYFVTMLVGIVAVLLVMRFLGLRG